MRQVVSILRETPGVGQVGDLDFRLQAPLGQSPEEIMQVARALMSAISFILGMIPLVVATGAGARQALGMTTSLAACLPPPPSVSCSFRGCTSWCNR